MSRRATRRRRTGNPLFRPGLESLERRDYLATFTVNTVGDGKDSDLEDAQCEDASGKCSLRAAIEQANESATKDVIKFKIPHDGPHIIKPQAPLPIISKPVIIDGYSQPGATPNANPISAGTNARILIALDGGEAGISNGLVVEAGNSEISGLSIGGFSHNGIELFGDGGNHIWGNFVGTDPSGQLDEGNSLSGVTIAYSSGNTIGGMLPKHRNLLSANAVGAEISGIAEHNVILGNLIGTDATGTAPLGNVLSGVLLTAPVSVNEFASNNFIGGPDFGAMNVISNNGQAGILVFRGTGNTIQGNRIGTNAAGLDVMPNNGAGVWITEGSNNLVGGTVANAGNLISGNDGSGVYILAGKIVDTLQGNDPDVDEPLDAIGNVVQGNLIGTDATGLRPLPNFGDGIALRTDSGDDVFVFGNTIGGVAASAANVISGNRDNGILLSGDVTRHNDIVGNRIGTDISGNITDLDGTPSSGDELGNGLNGIFIDGAASNFIGGTQAGEANIISGNRRDGISIRGKTAGGNQIFGNTIGTNALRFAALPNQHSGVVIENAPNNLIGTAQGSGNVIAANRKDGIQILGPNATNTQVHNNLIGFQIGTLRLGNGRHGIFVLGSDDNLIGGTDANEGNQILANGFGTEPGHGIVIKTGTGNAIRHNSIRGNNGLGIDLGEDGVTDNDDLDVDGGANRLQNYLKIRTTIANGSTLVTGILKSAPLTTFQVDFFSNGSSDPLELHEGETFLFSEEITTNADGMAPVFVKLLPSVEEYVTATVTDPEGNTSEFTKRQLVHSVEFTQAIQEWQELDELKDDLANDLNPPVPIVAGKPLAVRVYLDQLPDRAEVEIEVQGPTGLTQRQGSVIFPSCDAEDRRRRATKGSQTCFGPHFTFQPPQGVPTYVVNVKDRKSKKLLESHAFTFVTHKTKPLVLKEVSICDTLPFGPSQCQAAGTLGTLDGFLRAIAPTHDVLIETTSHTVRLHRSSKDTGQWMDMVDDEVAELFTLKDAIQSQALVIKYVGVTRPGLSSVVGIVNDIPGNAVIVHSSVMPFVTTDDIAQEILAHEVGHSLGAKHTNAAGIVSLTPPACFGNALDSESDWPYSDNRIQSGPSNAPDREVGFDVISGNVVLPDNTFEVMSYCWPNWVSPHYYRIFLQSLAANDLPSSLLRGDASDFWLVAGNISESDLIRRPLYVFNTMGSTAVGNGTHRILVQNQAGATLHERRFAPSKSHANAPSEEDEIETAPFFSELVPVHPDATSIVIIDPDGTELHRTELGGSIPEVTMSFTPPSEPLSGEHLIEWSVDDEDSQDHVYRIEYSADAGVTWSSLGTGITEAAMRVDFDNLPGSDGKSLLRVLASDDVNSGHALSQPFSVAFKLPAVQIRQPRDNSQFHTGTALLLEAAAFDRDDGYLGDDSFTWTSDRDGSLGNGNRRPVQGLSAGTHLITVTATDSSGNEVTDQVTINVVDQVHYEGPPPGAVEFDSATFAVDEDAGQATITVRRVDGSQGTLNVDFAVTEGTADMELDYQTVTGTLDFADGETTAQFTIPILDDLLGEGDETVQLQLLNPSAGARLHQQAAAELVIHDDELRDGQVFLVTNTSNSGGGSLRQALLDANASPGTDFIHFDIPGTGVHSIQPQTALPRMTGPVTIDGYTQPAARPNTRLDGNDARLQIQLDGGAVSGTAPGLHFTGGSSILRGLVIHGFPRTAVLFEGADGNIAEGNFVGTDASGTAAVSNGSGSFQEPGVKIVESSHNRIGGRRTESHNVISGNLGPGVLIISRQSDTADTRCHVDPLPGLAACYNQVIGNLIGVATDGFSPLGNFRGGIRLHDTGQTTVGGINAGQANTIAYNGEQGVSVVFRVPDNPILVHRKAGSGNAIRGNSIHSNDKLGIDLAGHFVAELQSGLQPAGDVTPNDPEDFERFGPNRLRNYPILHSALASNDGLSVTGSLRSIRLTEFQLDFFASPEMHATGFGEGRTYLGTIAVQTDEQGTASFETFFETAVPTGTFVTATATDPGGNTSEFSPRIQLDDVLSDTFVINTTDDADDGVCDASHCSFREAIFSANNHPGHDAIQFNISGDGLHTITPLTNLPPITDPVTIDGYTQPGAQANTQEIGNDARLLIELAGIHAQHTSTGLYVVGGESTIRGLVINQFRDAGIVMQIGRQNTVEGNYIGTSADGAKARRNRHGLYIDASDGNTIGGNRAESRNIISSNQVGVLVFRSSDNTALGNYIGPSGTGLSELSELVLGDNQNGIDLLNSDHNTIGTPQAGNVVSGHLTAAVRINAVDGFSRGNTIQNNLIGPGADKTTTIGNSRYGVQVLGHSLDNTIGGTEPGEGNTIAFSGDSGVYITSDMYSGTPRLTFTKQTAVRGNSIHSSGELGIEIEGNFDEFDHFPLRVTLNDPKDRDGHTNFRQNYPVLESAMVSNGRIFIEGRLESQPNGVYEIDLFASDQMDIRGYGEGKVYLGTSKEVQTDADGFAEFTAILPTNVLDGHFITATATTILGNTSEFSARIAVGDVLADTFTVNTTDDLDDGICDETHCSLREAIHGANNHAGPDTIAFNIPGDGVHTIRPGDPSFADLPAHRRPPSHNLPPITDPVTIDGYTQPGAQPNTLEQGNNALLRIELDGTLLGYGNPEGQSIGLKLSGGNSTVRGLVINRFDDAAIVLSIRDGNTIEGNFLESDPSGTERLEPGRARSLRIQSSHNLIGGTEPGARNLFGGPVVVEVSSGNILQGNYIGTNRDGSATIETPGPVVPARVTVSGNGNRIGGTNPGAGNVIVAGVGLIDEGNHVVQGNYIGVDRSGTMVLADGAGTGVTVVSPGNQIGGTNPGAGNVIAGFATGVTLKAGFGTIAEDNRVQGNYIGTDKTGRVALGNTRNGVEVAQFRNMIGGLEPGAGNLISGNGQHGVLIGERIGTRPDGMGSIDTVVQGNLIGTQIDGVTPLSNVMHGVFIRRDAQNSRVGGTEFGAGNTIAFNGGSGVALEPPVSHRPTLARGNAILSNSIHSNFDLGIDLAEDQVTANDAGDSDSGPNLLQNFPELTAVTGSDGQTTITGTLSSRPGSTYRLEFFAVAALDPTLFGEGQQLLGSAEVVTDASGMNEFEISLPVDLPAGRIVTATATDAQGNTSEFSGPIPNADPGSTANLSISVEVAPNSALQQEVVVSTVTIHNAGPEEATHVMLLNALPDGAVVEDIATSHGSCFPGFTVICSLGRLPTGATATVELSTKLTRIGTNTHALRLRSSQFDSHITDNNSTLEVIVDPSADLSAASITNSPVGVGDNVFFQVAVSNHGPSAATDVQLTDTLPESTTFLLALGVPAGTCSEADRVVRCDLGFLGPSAEQKVTLWAKTSQVGVITNRAVVTSSTGDLDTSNNLTTVDSNVLPQADLALTKTVDQDPATVGRKLTYTLKVTNLGPADAEGVTVDDELPTAITLDDVSSSQGSCHVDRGDVLCDIGSLAKDASASVRIVVIPTAEGILFNGATVDASGTRDPVRANDFAFVDTVVDPAPSCTSQNAHNRLDVNDDGLVLPIDALVLTNHINKNPGDTTLPEGQPPYMDPNCDQLITPLDILLVINALNSDDSGPVIAAELANDTGPDDQDGVTSDPTIEGSVTDLTGVASLRASLDNQAAVEVLFDRSGAFTFVPLLAFDGSDDGPHQVRFTAIDGRGNRSTLDVSFNLRTGSGEGETSARIATLPARSSPARLELGTDAEHSLHEAFSAFEAVSDLDLLFSELAADVARQWRNFEMD